METSQSNSSVIGRMLVVILLLFLLIGPLFKPVPGLLKGRFAMSTAVILLLLCFIIGFGIIVMVARYLERRGLKQNVPWLKELGFGVQSKWLPIVVGALVGIFWGILLMMSYQQFNPQANLLDINRFRVTAAILAAFGAFLEDLVTRGYLMNRLMQVKVPGWLQAVISALVFALYHTIWGFNAFSFIFSVVYGLILSGLFLWGKRSLTPVILGHSLAVLIGEPFASLLLFMTP